MASPSQPTMQTVPSSRATTAACDVRAPSAVTSAAASERAPMSLVSAFSRNKMIQGDAFDRVDTDSIDPGQRLGGRDQAFLGEVVWDAQRGERCSLSGPCLQQKQPAFLDVGHQRLRDQVRLEQLVVPQLGNDLSFKCHLRCLCPFCPIPAHGWRWQARSFRRYPMTPRSIGTPSSGFLCARSFIEWTQCDSPARNHEALLQNLRRLPRRAERRLLAVEAFERGICPPRTSRCLRATIPISAQTRSSPAA